MRNVTLALTALLLTAGFVQAEVKTKAIPYEHGGQQFEGVLTWDDSIQGKRPGVLVVHEWWGLDKYAKSRAEQLAKLGYVAFACDMYGKGKLADHPTQAREFATAVRMNVAEWQARAKKGLEILKSQEQTDPEHLAAIGYCFGGSTCLQLAYTGADLDAVATFHAAPQTPTEEQARHIKAKILVCHGHEDPFIKREDLEKMITTLKGAKVSVELKDYPGAVHSFTVPDADSRKLDGMKYDKEADEKSWKAMQELFKETLGK